ncbi:NADPH2:quinone reductase [Nakamurella sp. UYEF19]|uniref:medium chain dehydrogenase/reductase family protein n=1 Tax=Nakamurella sp. UYEF19 TaxID=1756392 RepID=UPI0033930E0F
MPIHTATSATQARRATAATPANGSVTTTEVVLPGIVEPDGLQFRVRQLAPPEAGQALIRVEATGVSFAEQGMRRGRYPGQPKFPFVPGYDLVGTVTAVGRDVDRALIGTRIAAATKTGGWATHAVIEAADLVPVAEGLDPEQVETLVVNGITAYQMLHRSARTKAGQTILAHGASGGVGSLLAQLAIHDGLRVIGTAAPRNHEALRTLGIEPIDYHDPDLAGTVRALAPAGVDAVFDHLGPASFPTSFSLLAPGGTLVAYGSAARLDDDNSMVIMFLGMLARLYSWNLLPNRRRANFYNFWAGHTVSIRKFRQRQRADLTAVLQLLADGVIVPQIAATFPLSEAAAAFTLAESHTVSGKVVLLP